MVWVLFFGRLQVPKWQLRLRLQRTGRWVTCSRRQLKGKSWGWSIEIYILYSKAGAGTHVQSRDDVILKAFTGHLGWHDQEPGEEKAPVEHDPYMPPAGDTQARSATGSNNHSQEPPAKKAKVSEVEAV